MLLPVEPSTRAAWFASAVDTRAAVVSRRAAPYVVSAVGLATLAFLLVWHQSAWDIQDWDEARHIVSAYEMLRSGDWLVNTYMGAPDVWNLKPPMSFWAIAASMRLFGYTPFAMHLPSIVATLGTAVTCWLFARRHAGNWAGAFAVLAVASCGPLVNAHTGRTADPDAIYLFALTVAITAGIDAFGDPRWLLVATTSFSVAFLSKSWHSVLVLGFLGAVSAALVIRGRANIRAVLLASVGFMPLIAWIIARYLADGARFLVPMVQYDLLSRTGTALEGHYETKTFYVDQIQGAFGLWLAVGALGIGLHLASGLQAKRESGSLLTPNRVLLLLFCWVAAVVVAFSLASTKLFWYVAPAYPAAALLSAIGIGLGVRTLSRQRVLRAAVVGVAAVAFVVGAQNLKVAISNTSDVPAQVALAQLGSVAHAKDVRVYLDPSLGGWSQSLVAVAETSGLRPDQEPAPRRASHEAYIMIAGDPAVSASAALVRSARQVAQAGGVVAYRLPG